MQLNVFTDACGFSAYAVYMHVYVVTDACGFSVYLATAVYMHVYVLTDACGFSACAAACLQPSSRSRRADGGEVCGGENQKGIYM